VPDMVIRSDDPRCVDLERAGWTLVAASWGARLRVTPALLERLGKVVARTARSGTRIRELTMSDAQAVLRLDAVTAADYPGGVATLHEPLDPTSARDLFTRGRVFGAEHDGALVAVTATEEIGAIVETAFTAVDPPHRGQGLATAVKAASVLAHAAEGADLFGTGGASANVASLAMNRAVGYEITETWHTYRPPVGRPG
jgi:GNAT superfamily N-acetyltransferase